jgi:hypothetical protein
VVEETLNVVDREKMFTIHRNDDGVPNLRDENLGLVLDFHIGSSENLGVDTLGKTLEDVCKPRGVSRRSNTGEGEKNGS